MDKTPSDTTTFEYRPTQGHGIFLLVTSTCLAIGLAIWALEGGNAFSIVGTGLYTLDFHPYLLWALAGFFSLGIAAGAKSILQSKAAPRLVTLSSRAITAPKSQLSNSMETVQYLDINEVEIADLEGSVILEIRSQHKRLTIPKVCIAGPGAFDQLVADLQGRVASVGRKL